MKNIQKIILFLVVFLIALILNVSYCSAEPDGSSHTANSYDTLISAIETAEDGDTIKLTGSIEAAKTIQITDKTIKIEGNGHTISKAEGFALTGSDGSLITVGPGGKATLSNLILTGSEKYGVQAYNGGYVILDDVTISDCKFGGVLVNGGIVEVIDITLGFNGESSNNGIEIGQGDEVTKVPKLVMNGTITSSQTENVIYIAENDNLSEFDVENDPNSPYKALVEGGKVVVVDEDNNVIFESNSKAGITIEGEDFLKNVTITIQVMDKTVTISKQEGEVLSKEEVMSKIDLAALGFENYTIEGFYLDNFYNTPYDFEQKVVDDITIYTKLTLNAKDETPKTGVRNNLLVAISIATIAAAALVTLRRKDV